MKRNLKIVFTIVLKDIKSESRTKDFLSSVFIFSLITVLIFSFALETYSETSIALAPGMLWVTFIFAGVLGFGRTFILEKENGCIDGLLLCPIDREVIYWGKLIGSFCFMLLVEVIILPIFFIFLNLSLSVLPQILVTVLLATLGIASLGTLFSALAVNTRARDIMLPILFLPAVIPILIIAVKSTGLILQGVAWSSLGSWLGMIAAFDLIYLILSSYLFNFVVES